MGKYFLRHWPIASFGFSLTGNHGEGSLSLYLGSRPVILKLEATASAPSGLYSKLSSKNIFR